MSRTDALRALLAKNPDDGMTRYMLATELYKAGELAEAVDHLETYVESNADEGAAYRTLADAYLRLGNSDKARWALRQGAVSARTHHHEGMAEEFEEKLQELEGSAPTS